MNEAASCAAAPRGVAATLANINKAMATVR